MLVPCSPGDTPVRPEHGVDWSEHDMRNPSCWRQRIAVGATLAVLTWPPAIAHIMAADGHRIDHSGYQTLLERYVDHRGRVDYRAWKARDVGTLRAYLRMLSATRPAELADRHERMAFWINAYNALTIDAVLEFYPIDSIKDKVSYLFGYSVWDDHRLGVVGRQYSLNDIEHDVLRPMGEPLVHFALVCASLSCPKLRNEAYTGERLRHQLEANARHFFALPDRLRLDRTARTVHLSPILKWFSKDFGGTDQAKLAFVRRFVASDTDRAFLEQPGLRIAYLPYDWGLNEQP